MFEPSSGVEFPLQAHHEVSHNLRDNPRKTQCQASDNLFGLHTTADPESLGFTVHIVLEAFAFALAEPETWVMKQFTGSLDRCISSTWATNYVVHHPFL